MSIDRISRPKATVIAATSRANSGVEFPRAHASTVSATTPVGSLPRVHAGELGREAYIEAHVQKATSHLCRLPPEALERVREQLRERCETDPLLSDLVARSLPDQGRETFAVDGRQEG